MTELDLRDVTLLGASMGERPDVPALLLGSTPQNPTA